MIYAYVRVSHSESAISGLSIAAQQRAILSYCQMQGISDFAPVKFPDYELPGFFVDRAISAYKVHIANRPAGMLMCAALQPGDTVILYKIDRGFRSTVDFANTVSGWVAKGIDVRIVTQSINLKSANGKFLANVLAAYAQWQSDMKSERSKMAAMIRKGLAPPRDKRKRVILSSHLVGPRPEAEAKVLTGKVYSYARISHESRLDGCSEDFQQLQCDKRAAWLLEEHPGLVRGEHFYDPAVSAYKIPFMRRPQAKILCSQLREGDHIVFTRLDRAWRSIHDLCDTWEIWENRGVNIHFCDTELDSSTAIGRMMLRIFGVLAQWESEDQSERTKAAFEVSRAEGRLISKHIPTGMYVMPLNSDTSLLAFDWTRSPRFLWSLWALKHHNPHTAEDLLEDIQARLENRRPTHRVGGMNKHGRDIERALRIELMRRYVRDIYIALNAARATDKPIGEAFLTLYEAIQNDTGHPSQLFTHPCHVMDYEWGEIKREFGPEGQGRLNFRSLPDYVGPPPRITSAEQVTADDTRSRPEQPLDTPLWAQRLLGDTRKSARCR